MVARKKDFNNIDLMETVEQATAEQPEIKNGQQLTSPAETLKAAKEKKTARVNLIFTPDNYAYCKIMAQARGQSLNEFINHIISLSREEHAEKYAKAIEFLQSF